MLDASVCQKAQPAMRCEKAGLARPRRAPDGCPCGPTPTPGSRAQRARRPPAAPLGPRTGAKTSATTRAAFSPRQECAPFCRRTLGRSMPKPITRAFQQVTACFKGEPSSCSRCADPGPRGFEWRKLDLEEASLGCGAGAARPGAIGACVSAATPGQRQTRRSWSSRPCHSGLPVKALRQWRHSNRRHSSMVTEGVNRYPLLRTVLMITGS
jgi:hypothetical protein